MFISKRTWDTLTPERKKYLKNKRREKSLVDFTKLFNKLISIGYNGPLMIEVYPKDYTKFDELEESKNYLQECLNDAYKNF